MRDVGCARGMRDACVTMRGGVGAGESRGRGVDPERRIVENFESLSVATDG